ncbi:MAG: type II toxin-antitoxin system HicB family antitoxin [Candidatus Hodarchaeales archaeon]|jgi:predicted RNase H-like HicB family nuclease
MKRLFTYVIEKDEDGYFIADVPGLPGCHTQAKTLDELENRIREAIAVYLGENKDFKTITQFIGIQQIEVQINEATSSTLS